MSDLYRNRVPRLFEDDDLCLQFVIRMALGSIAVLENTTIPENIMVLEHISVLRNIRNIVAVNTEKISLDPPRSLQSPPHFSGRYDSGSRARYSPTYSRSHRDSKRTLSPSEENEKKHRESSSPHEDPYRYRGMNGITEQGWVKVGSDLDQPWKIIC